MNLGNQNSLGCLHYMYIKITGDESQLKCISSSKILNRQWSVAEEQHDANW